MRQRPITVGGCKENFLATSNTRVNTDGDKQQATEWHTVVVWGKQAEACGQYLENGRQVYVEASLRYRSYEDRKGKQRHVAKIVAQKVRLLGGASDGKSGEAEPAPAGVDDIDEQLIPRIYRLGKLKKIPMTRLVNEILYRALSETEEEERGNRNFALNPEGKQRRPFSASVLYREK